MTKYYEPTAEEIKSARIDTKLTQQTASELCLITPTSWARYEQGRTQMPPPIWELFIMKVAELTIKGNAKPAVRDIDAEHKAMTDMLSDWRSPADVEEDKAYEQWCRERDERIAKLKGDNHADN
jgi:transcriptional regulator with XRE-family HTH domain